MDMGYASEEAKEAVDRFGDDLHAGCHWLMMRQDMGRVPKQLKRRKMDHARQTYIGSKVRLDDITWTVTKFDETHALVRLTSNCGSTSRWEHTCDSRIHWRQVRHDSARGSIPKATWVRHIGHFDIKTSVLQASLRPQVTQENAINLLIREGRPTGFGEEWKKWRTLIGLTKECLHEPSRPKPLSPNSENIHTFRCEQISYFNTLCDVYKLNQDTFQENLFNMTANESAGMFPESVRAKVKHEILKWKNPQKTMRKMCSKWREDCLPMVLVACEDVYPTFVRFNVHFHDMTFVRPKNYNPSIHLNFQRLFQIIFPLMKVTDSPPLPHSGLHMDYLDNVLVSSKKNWQVGIQPNDDFVTELYPYQKKCLAWMKHRETDATRTSDYGWHRIEHNSTPNTDFHFHANVFGHLSLTRPTKGIKGGLLAQEMGMGKTIEILALLATNNVKAVGPTLIVVPTTMLTIWQSEAEKHVPSFKVVKFHGPRRTTCMDDLRSADIVLTTYRIVVLETQKHVPTMGSVRFGRIVLDESHELRDANSATSRAVCRLYAPLRWCVSATPWPKAMNSVSSMLAFLGVAPFSENRNISDPYYPYSAAQLLVRSYDSSTHLLLHNILTNLTWYQKKRHVRLNLPAVTRKEVCLQHDDIEIYEHLKSIIRGRIKTDSESLHRNLRTRMMHYARWLRLAASHIRFNNICCYGILDDSQRAHSEVQTIETFVQALGNAEYDQCLKKTIESWAEGSETCAICMDAMDRPTITPCHHMFCFECIQSSYEHDTSKKCPLCRVPAGTSSLRELVSEDPVIAEADSVWTYVPNVAGQRVKLETSIYNAIANHSEPVSAKFRKVLEMVMKKEEKFIIFTQFHCVWKQLCDIFKNKDIMFSCIEGRMSTNRRDSAIRSFQEDPKVRAFVMTTKTASVGITLTAGSHVIFMEPCEDPSVSKQAVGRSWRIGQIRPVTVTTLKTSGTMDMFSSRDLEKHLESSSLVTDQTLTDGSL